MTSSENPSTLTVDGKPGSGRYPKGSGKKEASLPMTAKEKVKVMYDINNVYHAKYKGKRNCYIRTSSNEIDSPTYYYRFKNHGFDNYDIYFKGKEE